MAVFVKTDTGLFPAATVQGPQGPQGEPGPTGPQGPEGGALIGEIKIWPVATPPAKHLLCDGSTKLIEDYPDLHAVLGTTYGGDGVTTFGLPDLRDRGPVGASATKGLGTSAGRDSLLLLESNLPSHSHGVGTLAADSGGEHSHADTFAVATGGGHSHTYVGDTGGNSVDHTHGMASHTHTLSAHTHGLNGHTHGIGTHTHDLGNHTHAQAVHSHGPGTLGTDNPGGHDHPIRRSDGQANHDTNVAQGNAVNAPNVPTNLGGAHTHAVTTGATANSAAVETGGSGTDRTSGPSANNTAGNSGSTAGPSTPDTGGSAANTIGQSVAHNHSFSGTTSTQAAHGHTLNGSVSSGGAHTHTVSGSTAVVGSDSAVDIQNKYLALHFIIRAVA